MIDKFYVSLLSKNILIHIMKSNTQSKEVTITVDKIWELAKNTWGKVRSHQLTIKIDPI